MPLSPGKQLASQGGPVHASMPASQQLSQLPESGGEPARGDVTRRPRARSVACATLNGCVRLAHESWRSHRHHPGKRACRRRRGSRRGWCTWQGRAACAAGRCRIPYLVTATVAQKGSRGHGPCAWRASW